MRMLRRIEPMVLLATVCACSSSGGDGGFGLERRTLVAPLPLPFGLPQPGPAAWQDQFAFPRRTADQLGTWQHIGLFQTPLGAAATLPTHFAADDAAASLHDRARSWLDTNCAFCHRPAGPTPVDLDLRFVVAGTDLRAFGVSAVSSVPGGSGLRIVAGNHPQSELWQRLVRRDGFGMPPLGSFRVDPAVTTLIAPWIDAGLPPR